MAAGMTCGAIGSIFANPFYIAKTRAQSFSPSNPVGHQHAYSGMIDKINNIYTINKFLFVYILLFFAGPIDALMKLYKSGGLKELFQGTRASCVRMMVASPVQLVSYDFSKVYIQKIY